MSDTTPIPQVINIVDYFNVSFVRRYLDEPGKPIQPKGMISMKPDFTDISEQRLTEIQDAIGTCLNRIMEQENGYIDKVSIAVSLKPVVIPDFPAADMLKELQETIKPVTISEVIAIAVGVTAMLSLVMATVSEIVVSTRFKV